jgi:uncharacterized membrane protein
LSKLLVLSLALFALVLLPALALAGPRSGGSFGGRMGFRSGGGMSTPRSYSGGGSRSYYGGGGTHSFHFFPSFGWGWGGYGYGGGMGLVGTIVALLVVGVAVASVSRALRASRSGGGMPWGQTDMDEVETYAGRGYLYKLQLALGRSARGIQERLGAFAAQGDTHSESGLAALLQQTSLELLREKDAIRYASSEARGPMSLTNAETAMNGVSLAERSRFQVERVRSADGRLQQSTVAAEEGREALELVVVTIVVATRAPLQQFATVTTEEQLEKLLAELGGVSPSGLLGMEVIWTPADSNDSMTETDVMTTYPELRSL